MRQQQSERFQIKHEVMLFKVEEQENAHDTLFHWQLNTDKETSFIFQRGSRFVE